MNIKELFTEDRGVSPVIGVILMVAITVILAAVIGAFVLGLGDQASNTAPQASFSFDYDPSGDNDDGTVTATHEGGDTIPDGELNLSTSGPGVGDNSEAWGGPVSAGSSSMINGSDGDGNGAFEEDDTVRVVWNSGDSSNTLRTYTVPSNADSV